MLITAFLFCHFSQNTVWKGHVCWGLEAEEVGVRDAGGATHSNKTRAKTARAAPSKMVREAGASLGGEEVEEGTGATYSSSCQKGLVSSVMSGEHIEMLCLSWDTGISQ